MVLLKNLSQWILGLSRAEHISSADVSTISHHSHVQTGRVSAQAAVASAGSCVCEHSIFTDGIQVTDFWKCEALAKQLDHLVFLPNSSAYTQSIGSYWSLKNVDVHPSCVVLPESPLHVSVALSTLAAGAHVWSDRCQFAIRGGG